jgi:hypothetical protein
MSNLSIGSSTQSPWPLINRLIAAFVMGLILLVLSALIHTAAAATLGGGVLSYLWVTWLIAVVIVVVAALTARAARAVWVRLCVVNGLASTTAAVCLLALPEAALREMAEGAWSHYTPRPLGAALGTALASGAIGIAAVVAAIIFFASAYFFHHLQPTSHRPA